MGNDATLRGKEYAMTQASRKLVLDILKACNDQAKIHGKEFGSDLSTHFIACYIGAIVFNTLAFKPDRKLSEKQLYDIVSNNFSELKVKIQEAVAAGFTGAMKTHADKDLEYYCLIKPVPPIANKEPC